MSVKVTFGRAVRSEWTKLRSVRSTWLSVAIMGVLTVGLSGAVGYGVAKSARDGDPPPDVAGAVASAFLPIDFLVLGIGVLGILQMSSEYGSGLIRATLTALPRRLPVLAAKATVVALAATPVLAAICLSAFAVCQAFLGEHGASFGDPGVPGAILGAIACPVLVGLLGLGVGALLRHTAGAITTLVALLFLVPVLLGPALPGDRERHVLKYLPTVAGQAMYSVDGTGGPFEALSPTKSAVVMAGWAVALLACGAVVLHRRDA